MGRPSPSTKRQKRRRQKVRRKLKFNNSNSSSNLDTDYEQNNGCDYEIGRVLPDEIGEDTDVVHMKLGDFYQKWGDTDEYSHGYLMECRKQLMMKVKHYRCQNKTIKTEKAELILKHRNEIEEIRTFYQNIAYGTSCSGRIVKKSMSTSDSAKELLRMLGYEQWQKRQLESESDCNIIA